MEPERSVTRAIGRRFWRAVFSCSAGPDWFLDGLNQYTSASAIESQFEFQQVPPALAYVEARYFGAFIPRVIRIPLPELTTERRTELADDTRR